MSNVSNQTTEDAQLGLTFDESALVRKIQTGQTALFAELIARYQDRIYNFAYRLTGSAEDAADLSQETFTRAIRSIHQFSGNARFSTWLIRIMINITNDFKAHAKRERENHQQMQALLQRSQASEMIAKTDPQLRAQTHEMVSLLWQAMDSMDAQHRQVLLLRDLEQMSYQEIAQVLKVTEGTVKSRLFRAREALRELLDPVLNPRVGEEK
jgi:RNA polymerase sigma-70 factor (ECF subfamily)